VPLWQFQCDCVCGAAFELRMTSAACMDPPPEAYLADNFASSALILATTPGILGARMATRW
jgi:hypothetical protein